MIKPMEKVDLFMLMETYMREIGKMIKLKEEGFMSIWMEQSILGTGKRIDNMDMELRLGLMELNMKETMSQEKNTGSDHLNGVMVQFILVNFTAIIFMVKECTLGQIIENMKENGEQIRCMERELLHGQMEENILENMLTIRKKDMENLIGLMGDVIVGSG